MKNRKDPTTTIIMALCITLAVLLAIRAALSIVSLRQRIADLESAVPVPTPVSSETNYVSPDVHTPFGSDKSALAGNVNEAISGLYRLSHDQPEVLASTMSAFPSRLDDLRLVDASAEALDAAMDGERGGEIQTILLKRLKDLLEDPDIEITFAQWGGQVRMTYMVVRDENVKISPANVAIIWEYVQLDDDDTIMTIAVPRDDGTKDYGYFDMRYGFQRIVPVISQSLNSPG